MTATPDRPRLVSEPTQRQKDAIDRRHPAGKRAKLSVVQPEPDHCDVLAEVIPFRDARRSDTPPLPFPKRYHAISAGTEGVWTAACKACGYTHLTPWDLVAVAPDGHRHNGVVTWEAYWECPYVEDIQIRHRVTAGVALHCVLLGAMDTSGGGAA